MSRGLGDVYKRQVGAGEPQRSEPPPLAVPRRRVLAPWAAAAAVVIAGALAVPVADRVLSSGDDQTLAQQEAQDDVAGDGCPGCEESAGEASLSEPSPLAAAPPDLGPIDLGRLDELAGALGTSVTGGAGAADSRSRPGARGFAAPGEAPATTPPGGPATCEAEARRRQPDLGPLVAQGRGRVGDRPVVVLAFDAGPAATTRLAVLDATTCAQLASATP